MKNLLASFINTESAIGMIRLQLEKQLKKKVGAFDIMYKAGESQLYFYIDSVQYEYENNLLLGVIKNHSEGILQKGDTLQYILIEISKDTQITIKVYYLTSDGKKQFVTKTF